MQFPSHKCGLYLTHNEHRDTYEPIATYIAEMNCRIWESEEAKQRAIASDEVWELQWYPNTPISFCGVAAPTLEECLAFALKVEADERARGRI